MRPSGRTIPPLEYLDRYRNEGTRTYSAHASYSEAEARYRPDAEDPGFGLPTFRMPRDQMNVYAADPDPALRAAYLPGDEALLCVHPQFLASRPADPYLERTLRLGTAAEAIQVSPTSSTRTLLVRGSVPPHALKVHFPFRISRYGRRMRDEVVAQAIAVSAELARWSGREGGRFSFLREVLGVTHASLDRPPRTPTRRGENWGYLIRDLTPFPARPVQGILVPGFALYGRDFFDPAAPPLLRVLTEGHDPLSWTLDNVLLPVLRDWVSCFAGLGFVLEPHGQNVLLEVDADHQVTRLVHRDLSVAIDMRRRRDLGLSQGGLNRYNRMEDGAFNSIAYDKFMGGHFFDRVARAVADLAPGTTAEQLRGPCRDEFARLFPDHARYLPRTVRYFSEDRDRFGKPLHADTGLAPVWRP